MTPLFDFFTALDCLSFFLPVFFFKKNDSWYSLLLLGSGILSVNLVGNMIKAFFCLPFLRKLHSSSVKPKPINLY